MAMSEEKMKAIKDAIEKIIVSYKVDNAQIKELCPIGFLQGTMMSNEDTELYVLRTTIWTIDIVYSEDSED